MMKNTIVFNADAFNVPQGSMLDAIIKQLPGVKPPAQTTYLTVDTGDAVQSPQCTITSAPIYTLSGMRMSHTQLPRGVYIIAGRKIVVP